MKATSMSCTGLKPDQVCIAMVAKASPPNVPDEELAKHSCHTVCAVRGGPCLSPPGYACFGCDRDDWKINGAHIGTFDPRAGLRGLNTGHDVRGGGGTYGGGDHSGDHSGGTHSSGGYDGTSGSGTYGGGTYGGGTYGGGTYGGGTYGGGTYGGGTYGGGTYGGGVYDGGGYGGGVYDGGGYGGGTYGGGNVWSVASAYNALSPKCNQTVEPDVFTIGGHHFAVGARYGTPPHITDQFWELDENDNLTYANLPAHLLAYEDPTLMDPEDPTAKGQG